MQFTAWFKNIFHVPLKIIKSEPEYDGDVKNDTEDHLSDNDSEKNEITDLNSVKPGTVSSKLVVSIKRIKVELNPNTLLSQVI